ncbi:MAG: ABC transporter ATP-binding protein [Desulfobacteraceae bacterium 4572_130]|nr:MAG: ABC transporter ATP-binding protein [Desulfobacteraceae bacterium 4572_130]
MNKPIIELENISFSYPDSNIKILDKLNFKVFKNDKIGIIAPNGSGKTTLFYTIMGLCKPFSGNIKILGKLVKTEKDFSFVRSKIGLMFQDADDQLFSPTVLDDVAFGPLNLGYSNIDACDIAKKILYDLGLEEFENSITHRLSGGQKRLVAFASVLAMKPSILLLDEPTAGLDTNAKEKIEKILMNLDISYIVISHEFNFINKITNKTVSMENGKIFKDDEVHIHQHEHIHKLGKLPHKHV